MKRGRTVFTYFVVVVLNLFLQIYYVEICWDSPFYFYTDERAFTQELLNICQTWTFSIKLYVFIYSIKSKVTFATI